MALPPINNRRESIQAGFTLVETMVAVFILSLIIATTMTVIQKGLQSSYYARDQITAFYLAEEGVEFMYNIRNANLKRDDYWLKDINICLNQNCRIDAVNGTYAVCSGDSCALKQLPNGLYQHESGTSVRFSRTIRLEQPEPDHATVISTVTWSSGPFSTQTYVLKEELYNF